MNNDNWIRNLGHISNPVLLQEYITLYVALANVNLSDQRDTIFWKWTADGKYSVASPYECQFHRAMTTFPAAELWKATTETKCRFFAWLVLHNIMLTADNMAKRNWPCNMICSLCHSQQETTANITTECDYTKETWNRIATTYDMLAYSEMVVSNNPVEWVQIVLTRGSKKEKKRKLGVLFSFWWQIWKERNRRIFNNDQQPGNHVADIIQEELALLYLALDVNHSNVEIS